MAKGEKEMKWFRVNRKKLVKELIEDIVEDFYDRSKNNDWNLYLSNDIQNIKDTDKVILGKAYPESKNIFLYLNPIKDMLVRRIERLISHEINHLRGYKEFGAEKYAMKEKKYKELK